jgi:heptosyltransferase-2
VSAPASGIDRLVVRAPNWVGDAVLALPAIAAVRAQFPGTQLTVAAPASVAALFREKTAIAPDRVLELPAGKGAATSALRGGHFDACLLFPNSFGSAWQCRQAGIRERWGFATAYRGLLLTRRSRRPARGEARHQADYYRALVRGLDIPCDSDVRPWMRASEASLHRAEALLQQYRLPRDRQIVALMPGAAYGQAKQWPPERMAHLAARLVRERGACCVLLGASHDRDAARAIESWLRTEAADAAPHVLDLVGHTSLGALVGVLARSGVCVSNDSGGMHVASALGIPVVAIFGPTDDRATRPTGDHDLIAESVFCRPCMLRDCPIDHRCMKRITVDRVFAAVTARLDALPAPEAG